jgi:transposase
MASAPSAEQAEIRRLRRELERVQMERDILKKAVGIFSGPPR